MTKYIAVLLLLAAFCATWCNAKNPTTTTRHPRPYPTGLFFKKTTKTNLLPATGLILDPKLIESVTPYARYPVEAWGKHPMYYQQINEGRYDNKLTSDVVSNLKILYIF